MGQRYRQVVSYLVNTEVDSFSKGNTPITLNFNTVFQPLEVSVPLPLYSHLSNVPLLYQHLSPKLTNPLHLTS